VAAHFDSGGHGMVFAFDRDLLRRWSGTCNPVGGALLLRSKLPNSDEPGSSELHARHG
jgi:hypothetical protein